MADGDDTELPKAEEAARLRWRHVGTRVVLAGLAAACSAGIVGLKPVLVWFAVWAGSQAVEYAVLHPVVTGRRRMTAGRLRVSLATLTATVSVYGSLSVMLWYSGGFAGGVAGVLLLASAVLHNLLVCHTSRQFFLALVLPNLFFLALVPILSLFAEASTSIVAACGLGALSLGANALVVWRTIESTYRAEQLARVQLQASVERAEAATVAKSAFVATVSHELRTPMTGMLAAVGELERSTDPKVREHAHLVGEAGRLMQTLLNDLLDLAKIEAGRMTVETTAFDLRDLMEHTVRFWTMQANEKGLDLGVRGADLLPRSVQGDPTRLKQVLNNLLSNAVKFTEAGGVFLSVQAADETAEGFVLRASVSDTGPGLSPEKMARLFTAFDQADITVARKHGGTGLGLAISRELARLMGGDLTADSPPGAGATFTVKVPLAHAEESAVPVSAPAAPRAEGAARLRLLVVDDHQINRRALRLLLQPLDPEIVEAADGEQALSLLGVETFDAVLMDVWMPGLSGLDATRRLRGRPGPNRDTAVVAVTGSTEEKDVQACFEAGMDGVVGKPIDPRQLLQAVLNCTAAREEEAQALSA